MPADWYPVEAGANWETYLGDLHTLYQQTRQAVMHKTYPEVRFISRSKARTTGRAPPDYFGATPNLSILAEAKTTAKPRWSMNMLEIHQSDRLTEWEDIGPRNVSMVLLWMRKQNVRLVLPWEDLRDRWYQWHGHDRGTKTQRAKLGTASLTIEQLDRIGLRFDKTGWIGPLTARIGKR